jgi:hypothetical protein
MGLFDCELFDNKIIVGKLQGMAKSENEVRKML